MTRGRPTLFADDVERMASNKLYALRTALTALARILARRANCCRTFLGQSSPLNHWDYPDPPDWWYEPKEWERETPWQAFCEDMWRAMGIWDEDPS